VLVALSNQLFLPRLLIPLQFVEYDQRAHRLITLASFSFYVASTYLAAMLSSPEPC
jgi:hypothetical protein